METVNLLNFINNCSCLSTLEYASLDDELVDLLTCNYDDEQFLQKIDLGIVYLEQNSLEQYLIIDGLCRILSISLLLHSICECYKKTTPKNEKAIKTIREKYLLSGTKTKLRLPENYQHIYDKIIFGERLSGIEKSSPMFKLLHKYWSKIKEEGLQASNILKMLNKIFVTVIYTENIPHRDLYNNLNKFNKNINQISLVDNYLKNIGLKNKFIELKKIFDNSDKDLNLFFKDFFTTKFSINTYTEKRLYEFFTNYFETLLHYLPEDILIANIKKTALLYKDILTINFNNEKLKKLFIQIKMHNGEDTYAYLLSIYEDYIDNNISEATFLEILSTVDEYLVNRSKTPNKVSFNELIHYLNAFISCK